MTQLMQIRKGNSSKFEQGTWIHHLVATHLAQWISIDFSIFGNPELNTVTFNLDA